MDEVASLILLVLVSAMEQLLSSDMQAYIIVTTACLGQWHQYCTVFPEK